ncbi:hypothetical protein ACFLZ7_03150 [Nanoarchaeota archaeon]
MLKRGQITIFMILGLVIIATFSFVMYSTSEVQRIQLQEQAEKVTADILETTALETYVTLCADKALEDGLDLIGKQGGRILPEQGGLPTVRFSGIPFGIENKTYHISYGVVRESVLGTLLFPLYPCLISENFPPAYCKFISGLPIFPSRKYKFGYSNLPPLCKTAKECGYDLLGGSMSIQEQLEYYIANKTKECVDFSPIIGFNETYNITKGNVSVNLTIGESSLTAIIDFPLVFEFQQFQPVITFSRFETSSPARLKRVYKFANDLVKKDTTKLDFEIDKDANNTAYYYQSLGINRIKNMRFYDDLVRITDNTFFSGEKFLFQFMIENRAPVLDYIAPPGPFSNNCTEFDIVLIENKSITIIPKAQDPDDDKIIFEYSEWKADYVEDFVNATKETCPRVEYDYRTIANSLWDYNPADGIAELAVTKADIGYHNFTLTAKSDDFSDWQIVRVMVDDLPEVNANVTGPYSDYPDKYSIEDPFTLIAQTTDHFSAESYTYEWILPDQVIATNKTELKLPENPNIRDIRTQIDLLGIVEGKNTFRLDVYTLDGTLISSTEVNATFNQCIPHSSADPIYPYNISNPFAAKHSCCSGFSYAGSGITCFTKTTYGSWNSFNTSRYDLEGYVSSGISNLPVKTNSIFQRTFTRSCPVDRGNVCDGSTTDDITDEKQCTQICRGPEAKYLDANSETEIPFDCFDYPSGATFDEPEGDDVICKELERRNAASPFDCEFECLSGECKEPVNCVCAHGSSACNGKTAEEISKANGFVTINACNENNQRMGCNWGCEAKSELDSPCLFLPSSGCDAHPDCEGKIPGEISMGDGGKFNRGCNDTCGEVFCNLNVFDFLDKTDYCSDDICIAGYEIDDDEGGCVFCDYGSKQQAGGTCEEACFADPECDERVPGSNFIAGKCIGCDFEGYGCDDVDDQFAIVCGEIPVAWNTPESGSAYELRIERTSEPATTCDMGAFELTYSIIDNYLIRHNGIPVPISKGMNAKQILNCRFNVEFILT